MNDKTIQLEMTENQARIVSIACDLYSRIRMGQFREIIWTTLIQERPVAAEFALRREAATYLLNGAKHMIYPELIGNASYGVGKFEDADTAFDIHQVLRNLFGDDREPYKWGPELLPKVTILEDDEGAGE